jgi:hypothetical protein
MNPLAMTFDNTEQWSNSLTYIMGSSREAGRYSTKWLQ